MPVRGQRAIDRRILDLGIAAAILVGCSGGSTPPESTVGESPSVVPSVTVEPTVSTDPAGSILGQCVEAPVPTGEPVVLELRTSSSGFSTDLLEGPLHCEPFVIEMYNADLEAEHMVAIEPLAEIGTALFAGELSRPRQSARYAIPALPAGEYTFVCHPHRASMHGTLVVAES